MVAVPQKSRLAAASNADWDRWYSEHADRLLLFARTQTRSEADAQDVFQEAIVKTWRCREDGGAPPLSHVFRAIRQCAIDLGRSLDRRAKREEKAAEWFSESEVAPSGDPLIPEEVRAALMRLKPEAREVITLKIWGDQTFREIGEMLGIPSETAASRYRAGLASLRNFLAPKLTTIAS